MWVTAKTALYDLCKNIFNFYFSYTVFWLLALQKWAVFRRTQYT